MSGFSVGSAPDPRIAEGALQYQREHGLYAPRRHPGFGGVVMPTGATHAISEAYDRLPDFDRRALPSYRAMREEVGHQFDYMTKPRAKGGMGISVDVTPQDPYGRESYHTVVNELRNDVNQNNHMSVLSTKATGGHPFFSNDENDMFRAVHDTFGHLGSGRGVDRDGEDAAFRKHSEMFSPLARGALTTETRGQNSWLHGRGQGEFPEQKVGLLPEQMRSANFMQGTATAADRLRAFDKNRKQGLV